MICKVDIPLWWWLANSFQEKREYFGKSLLISRIKNAFFDNRHFLGIFDIYIIKQDIHLYMLPIAGQTAGPNGLNFCVDTHGYYRLNRLGFFSNFFFQKFYLFLESKLKEPKYFILFLFDFYRLVWFENCL